MAYILMAYIRSTAKAEFTAVINASAVGWSTAKADLETRFGIVDGVSIVRV